MTTSTEPTALVDTNILVYAVYPDSPHYAASRQLLDDSQDNDRPLAITSQVLAEFYTVVTRPGSTSKPRPPADALIAIDQFIAMPNMSLVFPSADHVGRWTGLAQQRSVTGVAIFDIQLIATMLANDINYIYTFNVRDFGWHPDLEVIKPTA